MTTALAWCSRAVVRMLVIAARSRPSLVLDGRPANSRAMVCGTPIWLPSGSSTATARCPALTSTATTLPCRTAASGSGAAGGVFHDASRYQRPRAGSKQMS